MIRRVTDADRDAVRRLAHRDSTEVPAGDLIGAEVDGELRAVISLNTGAAAADPFARTEEIMELLRGRLAYLRRQDPHLRHGRPALVSVRYGVGPPDVVQSIFPNGGLQAQRAFNPVSARC